MQFQLLLSQSLKNNHQVHRLITKLSQKQNRCLTKAENEDQREKCKSKKQHFEQYFEQYKAQFREKGKIMCCQAMKEHHELDRKFMIKDQCVKFYAKSIPIFEGNLVDKLKSLVQNTDFSQL